MVSLQQALAALVRPSDHRVVVLGEALAHTIPHAQPASSTGLEATLERDTAVLVTDRVDPTIIRALRNCPIALLVVTEPLDARTRTALDRIPGLSLLGPNAVVRVDPQASDDIVVVAPDGDELEGLARAFDASVRLALAPTPAWLPAALAGSGFAKVAGYVATEALDERWIDWTRSSSAPHLVVPVGVATLDRSELKPRIAGLERLVATHELERWTGPVFPAPRVLALVLAHLAGEPCERRDDAIRASQPAFWAQARRALPDFGAVPGMEHPPDDLALASPTAAFLAQRTILRIQAARAACAGESAALAGDDDPEGVERATEVLRGAGQILTDHESKVVLRGFGLEVTRQAVATSASGAVGFAERIGYPVVLKALSPDLRRRSDIGGVMLGLATAAAVRRAYTAIVDNIEHHAPATRLDGVLVSEMLDDGLDLECGAVRLRSGAAALYGRILDPAASNEPVFALAPLADSAAVLLAHAVLTRAPVPALRRQTDPDVAGLAAVFRRIDRLLSLTGDRIESIELGPLRCAPDRGYVTLDARITQQPHLEGV